MLRDEPISEKVDLYGFGIMLWEMYTGKLPWSDKNYHQMIHTVAVCLCCQLCVPSCSKCSIVRGLAWLTHSMPPLMSRCCASVCAVTAEGAVAHLCKGWG